jgi:drug/metabolite transporter (DMT)-like permease
MTLLLAAFARTELYRAVILSSLAPALQVLLLRVFRGERFPVGVWAGTVIAIAGAILAALST